MADLRSKGTGKIYRHDIEHFNEALEECSGFKSILSRQLIEILLRDPKLLLALHLMKRNRLRA